MFVSLEGDDYTIEPFSVEITASEVDTQSLETMCRSIQLVPDVLIEANEDIQLQLITANTCVNLTITSAVVIIQDVVRENYRRQEYSLLYFPPLHCSLIHRVKLLPTHLWISQQECPVETRQRKIWSSLVRH